MIEIEGIVPVKTSSVRVKNKNLRKFANTSLYMLRLKQLKKTKKFKNFIISSEDQKVLNVASKFGFKTHLRDKYYCTSKVPMSEVYTHLASQSECDHVAWINVTNPLVDCSIYDKAVDLYRKNLKKKSYDCLLSAVKNKENYFFNNKLVNFKRSPWPRSQDLKPLVSLPFVINILRKESLKKWGSCVGRKPFFYYLDPLTASDIDNQYNFDFCEYIYKNKKKYNLKI
jgi:N-acylneuraminate cytidylyltransferase